MGQFAREILRESVYVHNHIRTYTMNKTIMCICRPIARQGYGGDHNFSRGQKLSTLLEILEGNSDQIFAGDQTVDQNGDQNVGQKLKHF